MSRDWWVNPGGSEHLCMGIGGYHRGADFMMTAAGKIGEKPIASQRAVGMTVCGWDKGHL